MMKITNVSQGPRGIHTAAGLQIIPVGGSIEAELSKAELDGSKETGWFAFGAAAAKAAAQDPLDHDGDGKKGGAVKAKG